MKNTRSADFCADRLDFIRNFAVIMNVVIKRVQCIMRSKRIPIIGVFLCFFFFVFNLLLLQSTLVISTSVISNNRLSRREILIPVLT